MKLPVLFLGGCASLFPMRREQNLVRMYDDKSKVAACRDLGMVTGRASGWGEKFRPDAENDAQRAASDLGADAIVIRSHEAGFSGHMVTADAYRCDRQEVAALDKPTRVLLLDFRSLDGDARVGEIVTGALAGELQKVKNLIVISRADIEAVLDAEKKRDLLGCTDTNCMLEIAGALGTTLVLYGSIGSIGSQYAINASLFDTRLAKAKVRVSRTVVHAEDTLIAALPELSAELARGIAQGD